MVLTRPTWLVPPGLFGSRRLDFRRMLAAPPGMVLPPSMMIVPTLCARGFQALSQPVVVASAVMFALVLH